MPPLNDKKLEKIQKLLEIANEDFATPDDVIKMSEALIGVVVTEKNKLESQLNDTNSKLSTEITKTLAQLSEKENGLRAIISRLSAETDKALTDTQNTLSREIKRVERRIPTKTDLTGLEGRIEAIQEALTTVPTEITANPEAVRDALELLSGDDRLDKSAIRGLDELIEDLRTIARTSQPQAVGVRLLRYLSDVNIEGITDGQTLVWDTTTQRFVPGNGGGGGGAVDSVNGQTGVVVLDANDVGAYTEAEVDTLLGGKANTSHTHVIADTTGLQTALDGKAPTSHTHTVSQITDFPTLATVATSGDYDDLSNKPDLSVFDEVEQYANLAAFPGTGNSAKFYLAQDTGLLYRWTGATYAVISAELALGETSTTAYRGDRGKTAYDHSQLTTGNPHNVTKSDVGLGSVDNVSAASLRDRSTHTGTQLASTISDFTETAQDAIGAMLDTTLTYVDGTPLLQRAALTGAITAAAGSNTTSLGSFTKSQLDTAVSDGNVLYVGDVTTNATHTGEVTGSGALTVDKTAITNKTDTVITASDRIIFADASDTDNLKSDTVQGILDLVTGGSNTYFNDIYIDQSGGTSDTYGVITGTINGSNALFTVSQSVYATGTLKVWLNGQLMTQGTGEDFVETTPASGTFTFNTAPATDSLITVEYQKVVTNSDTIGNVQGPASATDNAVARYDSTTGKLIQNSAMTVDDAGAFTATDGSKVTGATTGAFGYIVLAVENTDDEGRAELSLDTDDGAYAGFIVMGGSNASGTPRRLDIGTRVNGPIGFWTDDTIRAQMEATGEMEFYHEVTVPHEVFDDTAWSTSPLVPTQQAVRDRFRVAVVRVIHGSTAGTTRPDTPYVEWVGSVEPTNATNNDTWVVTP